jgi:hypothetical protein
MHEASKGRKEKGVTVFGTIKMGKKRKRKKEREKRRRRTQINFHPENCFENARKIYLFSFVWLLYDEKSGENPFFVSKGPPAARCRHPASAGITYTEKKRKKNLLKN